MDQPLAAYSLPTTCFGSACAISKKCQLITQSCTDTMFHVSSQLLIYGCKIQRCKNVESRHQESSQAASKYKYGAQLFLETCSSDTIVKFAV